MNNTFDNSDSAVISTGEAGRAIVVAALIADGIDERQYCGALRAFYRAGCRVENVSPQEGLVQARIGDMLGHHFRVSATLGDADTKRYDMLFVPGGAQSLRNLSNATELTAFVESFESEAKPVVVSAEARALVDGHVASPIVANDDDADRMAELSVGQLRVGGARN